MACTCHSCGKPYKVDVIIDDDIWEKIKPLGSPVGGGLLCGPCIMDMLESYDAYMAFNLIKMK